MGNIQFHDGLILFDGTQIAMDPNCCCGAEPCSQCNSGTTPSSVFLSASGIPNDPCGTWNGTDYYLDGLNGEYVLPQITADHFLVDACSGVPVINPCRFLDRYLVDYFYDAGLFGGIGGYWLLAKQADVRFTPSLGVWARVHYGVYESYDINDWPEDSSCYGGVLCGDTASVWPYSWPADCSSIDESITSYYGGTFVVQSS